MPLTKSAPAVNGEVDVELGNLLELPAPGNGTPELLYASLHLQVQSRCIRVLDVDPLPALFVNHAKQPLSGKLRIVSLQDCPRFMALSYVWGGYSTPRDVIYCNGGIAIEITTNCRDALIALRKRYGTLTIWVDAICVNQQNIQEKSTQIPLMEEIYSWAERVLVWLGPGDNSSRKAMHWLRRASYGSFFDAFVRITSIPASTQRFRYKLALMSCIMWCAIRDNLSFWGGGGGGGVVPIWSCLRRDAWELPKEDVENIFGRDWFNRAWTFQEILLAWNITIICGNSALDWGHLLGALEYCYDSGAMKYTRPYDSKGKRIHAMRELVQSWMNIIRPTHWNGKEIRRPLSIGGDSADSHQKKQTALFFRPRASFFKIWYCSVSALFAYITAFLLFLLVIAVPIVSNAGMGVTFSTMMKWDAAVSIVIGMIVLSLLLGHVGGLFSRCHFRLEFGNPNHDATAIHISSIIRVIRERMVSEPKDRSYATYGVLRRLGVPLHPADYGKPLGQVYRDLFIDLVRWEPCMISLILDSREGTFSDLPSWVPNWNAPNESLVELEYVVNFKFQSRLKSTNSVSIDGSRLTVAILWTEAVRQTPITFHPMDRELFLSNSDHFAAAWDQVLYLAQWMSLFCDQSPTEEQNSNERQDFHGENVSDAGWGTISRKRTLDAQAAYEVVGGNLEECSLFIGDDEEYEHNWYRLVDIILPAFVTIGALHPTARFEAVREFIRNDPDADLAPWGRYNSSHRGAVEVLVEVINESLVHGRQLFSTALKRPGSVLGGFELKDGDLVAQVEGVYWPLVLRRTDTALEEYKVVGHAFVSDTRGSPTMDGPLDFSLIRGRHDTPRKGEG